MGHSHQAEQTSSWRLISARNKKRIEELKIKHGLAALEGGDDVAIAEALARKNSPLSEVEVVEEGGEEKQEVLAIADEVV